MNRRSFFLPFLGLILLWTLFAGYVALTAPQLPAQVATHFNALGEPNGWMNRAEHVRFTLLAGIVVPAFVLGIFSVIGRPDGKGMKVQHKELWFAPERREATLRFVRRQGFLFAAMFMAFLAGIHWSILAANQHLPAHLSTQHVGWIAGTFGAACLVWVLIFLGKFARKPL